MDIAIDKVTVATPDLNTNPKAAEEIKYQVDKPLVNSFEDLSKIRNREDKNITFYVDKDKDAQDFYYRYDRGQEKVSTKEYTAKKEATLPLDATDKDKFKNMTAYQIDFVNKGGLVMPIILEFTFEDGSKLYDKSAAQIWRLNEQKVSKTYYFDKKLKSIQLDPMRETADIDTTNNFWSSAGSGTETSKFQLFKQKQEGGPVRGGANGKVNPMQAAGKS